MLDTKFEEQWKELIAKLEQQFGEDIDMQAILFLVGVQELGQGFRTFSKDEKVDVMHIAICTLLSRFGFYELEYQDQDGWPHFKATKELPNLKPGEQLKLMKQALIEYFAAN